MPLSTVIKLDYYDESYTINLNNIAYLSFIGVREGGSQLQRPTFTIKLHGDCLICFRQYSGQENLENLYLDTYTKWKSYLNNLEREDEIMFEDF